MQFLKKALLRNINKSGIFLPLTLFIGAHPIDRHSNFRDRSPLGGVPKFGIPREIPDQHHLIQIRHSL